MTMLQTASESAAAEQENPLVTLSAQWYNAVVRQLGLSSKAFLLQQPLRPLPLTAEGLWALFDAVPPRSVGYDLGSAAGHRFSSAYRAVVHRLAPVARCDLAEVLGDDLAAWNAYVKALRPMPKADELGEVFFSWAMVTCPDKAAAGRAELEAMVDDPVNRAAAAVRPGRGNGIPDFGVLPDDVRAALRNSSGASIHFDSAKESGDVSTTWARCSVSGTTSAGRFLTGADGDASWQSINEKAAQSQILVEMSFDGMATVQGPPGRWYSPAALCMAYRGRDDARVWRSPGRPGCPDWEWAFGPDGRLARMVGSLVLVDGVKVKMTSTAQYGQQEQRQIEESFGGGVWPFVGLARHGGRTSRVKFDKDGAAVFTTSCDPGSIFVLGANVVPVSTYLGVDGVEQAGSP